MNRYLLELSYIGTTFRGIQKTFNKLQETPLDTSTIQGCLEIALRKFKPMNEIQTVLSSRTDAGVHALYTTLHVDLQNYNSTPYDVTYMRDYLNRTLAKQSLPIRVLSTRIVSNNFHCRRNALGRTYLYRIAVAKKGTIDSSENRYFETYFPVEEVDRCFFLQKTFDIERMIKASRLFLGRHDFRTFMSVSHETSANHPMFSLRAIKEINIKPGKTTAIGPNAKLAEDIYDYWDIELKAKSFLYKQVRRIVGALVAVATDRIDEKCLYEMLTIPSKHTWNPRIALAPPHALYLCRVHYNENDLKLEE